MNQYIFPIKQWKMLERVWALAHPSKAQSKEKLFMVWLFL